MATSDWVSSLEEDFSGLLKDSNCYSKNLVNELLLRVAKKVAVGSSQAREVHFSVGEDNSEDSETDASRKSSLCSDIHKQDVPVAAEAPVLDQKVEKPMDDRSDEAVLELLDSKKLKHRDLEKQVSCKERAVAIRRTHIERINGSSLENLPYKDYDYEKIHGACCENPIGFVPLPVGCVGPLKLDGDFITVPMATTEGTLIASTNRGCRVIEGSPEGVKAVILDDKMTRAPMVEFGTCDRALEFYLYLKEARNFEICKREFASTTKFGRLVNIDLELIGTKVILRFCATTGDAMGMNMVSKGANKVLEYLKGKFPDMDTLTVSSNYCADKKATQVNWMKGRGKTVQASCTIPKETIESVLKTSVDRMVEVGVDKCLLGSTLAGTIGGYNCHAANIVTAIFIATGQDPAQVVSSSMCITTLKKTLEGDLSICCKMNCLEVGTVGGGTFLDAQKSNLEMLKCWGSNAREPGDNAKRLAKIICATVLAGELSLLAAQCTHTLVSSHMNYNRSKLNLYEVDKPKPTRAEDQSFSATLRIERPSLKNSGRKDAMEVQCSHLL